MKFQRSMTWAVLLLAALLMAACATGGGATTEAENENAAAPAPTEAEETEAVEPTVEPTAEVTEEATAEAPAEATAEATAEGTAEGGVFRVALVMPSARNDQAFSQSMYDALVRIQEEMGEDNFQFDVSENMFILDEAATQLRTYAGGDYDLVIAHGSQYGSLLQEIAPDFPDVSFAWGTTLDTMGLDNVFAYEARSEQGGYVNGVMAAELSDSDVIGVIGPIDTGDAGLYVDGFVAGVQATEPDTEVNETWTQSFSDANLAAQAATAHIDNGADVLTGTAQMVVGAIGVAQEEGVLWFGTQSNQTSLAPDIVVASQVYHWEVILRDMIGMIQDGTLGGESFGITLENGGLVVEYNEDFDLPDNVRQSAQDAVDGIISGEITVVQP